ncbi:MAG TPA: RNA polymerase sigma factor [Nitriliruptorales bacterium]|nr:RNA polymerase sigma factor [Nitriliruptorales bacterium]
MTLPPFQALLDTHGRDVHRFLLAMVGPDEADDCYQETVLAALRAYPSLRYATNLRGWLVTIAHRKAVDSHRARGRRAVPVAEVDGGRVVAAAPSLDGDDALWAAVRALPGKQRAAVVHRYVNDLSYADVARLLDCSPDAARRNVHEGLRKLRRWWEERT